MKAEGTGSQRPARLPGHVRSPHTLSSSSAAGSTQLSTAHSPPSRWPEGTLARERGSGWKEPGHDAWNVRLAASCLETEGRG